MALRNTKLTKVGSTSLNGPGVSNSGHTQACIVVPANPLPQPTPIPGESAGSWSARWQAYVQSITPEPKYGQDWE